MKPASTSIQQWEMKFIYVGILMVSKHGQPHTKLFPAVRAGAFITRMLQIQTALLNINTANKICFLHIPTHTNVYALWVWEACILCKQGRELEMYHWRYLRVSCKVALAAGLSYKPSVLILYKTENSDYSKCCNVTAFHENFIPTEQRKA